MLVEVVDDGAGLVGHAGPVGSDVAADAGGVVEPGAAADVGAAGVPERVFADGAANEFHGGAHAAAQAQVGVEASSGGLVFFATGGGDELGLAEEVGLKIAVTLVVEVAHDAVNIVAGLGVSGIEVERFVFNVGLAVFFDEPVRVFGAQGRVVIDQEWGDPEAGGETGVLDFGGERGDAAGEVIVGVEPVVAALLPAVVDGDVADTGLEPGQGVDRFHVGHDIGGGYFVLVSLPGVPAEVVFDLGGGVAGAVHGVHGGEGGRIVRAGADEQQVALDGLLVGERRVEGLLGAEQAVGFDHGIEPAVGQAVLESQ